MMILVSTSIHAQQGKMYVPATFELPSKADIAMRSIQERGLKRGVNMQQALDQLWFNGYPAIWSKSSIQVLEKITRTNNETTIGLAVRDSIHYTWEVKWHFHVIIQIESLELDDFYVGERILAHEIGHWFDLDHSCRLITIDSGVDSIACDNIMIPVQVTVPCIEYDRRYRGENTEAIWDYYFEQIQIQIIKQNNSKNEKIIHSPGSCTF